MTVREAILFFFQYDHSEKNKNKIIEMAYRSGKMAEEEY